MKKAANDGIRLIIEKDKSWRIERVHEGDGMI